MLFMEIHLWFIFNHPMYLISMYFNANKKGQNVYLMTYYSVKFRKILFGLDGDWPSSAKVERSFAARLTH